MGSTKPRHGEERPPSGRVSNHALCLLRRKPAACPSWVGAMTYRLPDDAILALLTAADEARAERIARRAGAPGIDALGIIGTTAPDVPPEHMPGWMAYLIPS